MPNLGFNEIILLSLKALEPRWLPAMTIWNSEVAHNAIGAVAYTAKGKLVNEAIASGKYHDTVAEISKTAEYNSTTHL